MSNPRVLPWNARLATGLPEIDTEHRLLIKLVNRLCQRLTDGVGAEEFRTLLGEFKRHTEVHFQNEEDMMYRYAYVVSDAHRHLHFKAHQGLLACLDNIGGLAGAQPSDVIEHLLALMAEWLGFHIQNIDKRLAKRIIALRSGSPIGRAMVKEDAFEESLVETMNELYESLGKRTLEMAEANGLLQENEQRYHSLFDHMLGGFAYCQMIYEDNQPQDFVYLEVNAAFEHLTRLKNVTGKKISEVIPGLRESDPQLFEIYGRVAAGGAPERLETYVKALDIWLSLSVYSPRQGYFVVVFDDISARVGATRKLAESRNVLQSVMDTLPIRVFWRDRKSRYLGCNMAFAIDAGETSLLGVIGKTDAQLAWGAQTELYRTDYQQVMDSGIPKLAYEEPRTTPDGKTIWLSISKMPLRNEAHETIGVLGVYEDITARRLAEESMQLASSVYQNSSEAMIITDANNTIITVNPAFTKVTGYTEQEVVGRTPKDFSSGRHDKAFFQAMWQELSTTGRWQGEIWDRRKNGEEYAKWLTINTILNAEGKVHRYVALFSDITEKKKSDELIWQQANFDTLTGLPNRRMFHDRLEQEIKKARRTGLPLALLFLDLDRFKEVNDTMGHDMGDLLLKEAAQRLTGCVRETDTVARLGGDEFTLILSELDDPGNIERIVRNILRKLAEPFLLGDEIAYISASIGITFYPEDATAVEELVKQADQAMYASKEAGRNTCNFFNKQMNIDAVKHLSLSNSLRRALEQGNFVLYYQPLVDVELGRAVGVEALVRWMHPEHGLVPPAEFIPLAEETGLIVPLTEWVLETACTQLRAWQTAGLPVVRMGVNLSACHFRQPGLVDTVARVLHKTHIDPRHLELEITESVVMQHTETTVAILKALKNIGVQLAVDDFGTGYSSLSYLKMMPVGTLKIDRAFVCDVTTDPEDAALAKAIIAMAHSLHLRVTAEGVETEGQLNFFVDQHCDEIQGYYFSRPVPAEDCAKFLQQYQLPNALIGKTQERTLLVVDDEVNIAASIKRLLRGDGYRVLTAESARAGLELLATNEVGVIISDQRMPEMTGVDFLRRVKELYPDTIRIVLSGYTDLKTITDAINEGAIYKFLTKPWEDEQLRENVHEAFQRYDLKLENVRLGREVERANDELFSINKELKQRVEEKTMEICHNLNILQISQEILEYLPAAVIGVDDDGLIVLANSKANALFAAEKDGPLFGCEAQERLPAPFLDFIAEADETAHGVTLADGRHMSLICHRMGEMCESKGTVAVITPNGKGAGNIRNAQSKRMNG